MNCREQAISNTQHTLILCEKTGWNYCKRLKENESQLIIGFLNVHIIIPFPFLNPRSKSW